MLNSELIGGENYTKTIIFLQICCCAILPNISGQLCSFAAQLIQFKVMQRCLITVNIFFVGLHRLFYHICLECLPSSRIYALNGARQKTNKQIKIRETDVT